MKRGKAAEQNEQERINAGQPTNLATVTYTLKDKIDFLLKVIGRFDFYINSTNTKASLILAWNGVVIGALLLKYKDVLGLYPATERFRLIVSLLLSIIGICAAISNIVAFQVIFPFLKSSSKNPENSSTIFFGSVGSMSSEEYFDKVSKSSIEETLFDLTDQGVTLAQGLQDKMQKLRRSIKAIYAELCFVGLLFILKFVAQYMAG